MTEDLITSARRFRTESRWAEKLLWRLLRNHQMADYKFRRQQPIGHYVLDFYCPKKRLAIELDGREHGDPGSIRHDQIRDAYLRVQGIRMLRFWNFQLRENLDGVLQRIRMELENNREPLTPPSPSRGLKLPTLSAAALNVGNLKLEGRGRSIKLRCS